MAFEFRVPKYERLRRMAESYPSLDMDPTALEAFLVLVSVSEEVSAALETSFARDGLGQARSMVLVLLLENQPDPLSHSKLAELSGVTKGTITGLVDALERDGYVRRENSGEDRRVTPVALTPAGRQLIERILPAHNRQIAGLMGKLSVSERKTLVSLLRKVQAGLPAFRSGRQ